MKRRAALALALCLTVIVGFFIVGYGTQIGFFGGHRGPDDAAAQADPMAAPTQPPAAAAPAQPQVIEELVYRDVFVSGGEAGAGSTSTGDGGAAPQPSQGAAPAPANPPAPTPTPATQPTPKPAGHSVEFTGEITSVSGSTFTVDTQSGEFTVKLDGGTSVRGQIEVGARVSVHGYQGTDGIVVADEIEVSGDD
jgi:hypothetical protein